MTKLNRTLKGLTALLMSLAMAVTMGLAALAASTETMTETIVVTQVIKTSDDTKKIQYSQPQRTEYTYVLTPKRTENPMPEGTEDGKYTVGPIWGEAIGDFAPSFTIEIDKTQPGVYEYILEKVETTPDGDSFSPEKHIFGYKVERNDNGELVVIPYICQSGQPIFSDPDENGYPTKLTLPNVITGAAKTAPSTTTTRTVTRSVTGNVRSTTRVTTTGGIRARWVNTGDPMQLMLWIVILVIALAALIILFIARRRKDDEEEETK